MARMKMTKKTIDGRVAKYRDWWAEVVAEADRVAMPEALRAQVHEAWMHDGWLKNETPAFFVATAVAYLTDKVA